MSASPVLQLSVIIPIYNVEGYIKKCVLSLQHQDIPMEEFELVIINDGSPDNSKGVVLELMQSFPNIIFIDQENKGVSMARNAGINKAKGKYLLFIDPDDYVVPNAFSRILKTSNQRQAVIVFLGYQFRNADDTVRKEIYYEDFQGKSYPGIEAYSLSRGDGYTDPDRSVAILYERQFINSHQLRYIPDVPYLEDGEFLARVLCLAGRCIFEGNPFYIRTTRQGSATNSGMFFSDKAINGFFYAANNLKKFKYLHDLNKSQMVFLNQPIAKFTLLTIQGCMGIKNYQKFIRTKDRLKNEGLDSIEITGCSGIYRKYGCLFNKSVTLFYFVWNLRLLALSLKYRTNFLFGKEAGFKQLN